MKLSILICSVERRKDQLQDLLDSLFSQIYPESEYNSIALGRISIYKYITNDIEIIVAVDNKQISVGSKRNILLSQATGNYITFIDDDDTVTDDYVKNLLFSTQFGFDAVMFYVIYNPFGGRPKLVKYSAKYEDRETKECYYRKANHLMMIKRSLAKQVGFKDMRRGEDFEFAKRLSPLIKNEGHISSVLYYYNFDAKKTETQ